MKIKTGDTVKVITGHYKGTISEVKAVFPKTNKIVVEGVNMIKKVALLKRKLQSMLLTSCYMTRSLSPLKELDIRQMIRAKK